MQQICEIEYEKVKQRSEGMGSKSFAQSEVKESIINH